VLALKCSALEKSQIEILRSFIKKRSENTPLQHLIGTVDFFDSTFFTDERALIPRPETEELVRLITTKFPPGEEPEQILDLGCGSGVIGLSLAKFWPNSQITLADFSEDALALSQKNATSLDLVNVSFQQTDLFSNLNNHFDLIVANLPYVAETDKKEMTSEVLDYDPHLALFSGEDGLDLIRTFCAQVPDRLYQGGLVAMEIGYNQAEEVEKLLKNALLNNVHTLPDLNNIHRFPFGSK